MDLQLGSLLYAWLFLGLGIAVKDHRHDDDNDDDDDANINISIARSYPVWYLENASTATKSARPRYQ